MLRELASIFLKYTTPHARYIHSTSTHAPARRVRPRPNIRPRHRLRASTPPPRPRRVADGGAVRLPSGGGARGGGRSRQLGDLLAWSHSSSSLSSVAKEGHRRRQLVQLALDRGGAELARQRDEERASVSFAFFSRLRAGIAPSVRMLCVRSARASPRRATRPPSRAKAPSGVWCRAPPSASPPPPRRTAAGTAAPARGLAVGDAGDDRRHGGAEGVADSSSCGGGAGVRASGGSRGSVTERGGGGTVTEVSSTVSWRSPATIVSTSIRCSASSTATAIGWVSVTPPRSCAYPFVRARA